MGYKSSNSKKIRRIKRYIKMINHNLNILRISLKECQMMIEQKNNLIISINNALENEKSKILQNNDNGISIFYQTFAYNQIIIRQDIEKYINTVLIPEENSITKKIHNSFSEIKRYQNILEKYIEQDKSIVSYDEQREMDDRNIIIKK